VLAFATDGSSATCGQVFEGGFHSVATHTTEVIANDGVPNDFLLVWSADDGTTTTFHLGASGDAQTPGLELFQHGDPPPPPMMLVPAQPPL
jgi:hypothetical protein